jgi:3-hydroxybutyryl-CoA dehydrogenase
VWASFGNDPRFAPSLAQRSLVEAGWLGRKVGRGCYDYADGAVPPAPAPAASKSGPAFVISHGDTELAQLLSLSGVSVQQAGDEAQEADRGLVELPGGPLLARSTGVTATALAKAAGQPVIVVDRTLDDATATAIAVAPSAGCPADDLDMAVGLLQAAGLTVFVIDDVPGLIVTRTVAMLANLAADALASRVASAADIDTAMRLGVNYPQGPLAWAGLWGLPTVLAALDELENWYRDGRYRPSPLLRRTALTNGPLANGALS